MTHLNQPRFGDREHTGTANRPIAGGYFLDRTPTVDRVEPTPPRTRVNVKQLANGKWQPEITCESYDADPLIPEDLARIRERLEQLHTSVSSLLFRWNEDPHG